MFVWNLLGLKKVHWESAQALAPGKHTLEFDFVYDGLGMGTLLYNSFAGIGQGGTGVLKVDGTVVATQKMEHTIPYLLPIDESLDIGSDTLTSVDEPNYVVPFAFTGKLGRVTLAIDRPQITPADIEKLKAAEAAAAKAKE
jgi:arylsulfatase